MMTALRVHMPNADLLQQAAWSKRANTGSAFEVSPPRKTRWGSLFLVLALACCAAMAWGAVIAEGRL